MITFVWYLLYMLGIHNMLITQYSGYYYMLNIYYMLEIRYISNSLESVKIQEGD